MPTNKSAYWQEMKEKSAERVADIADDNSPDTEQEMKELLAYILKHGTCREASDAIVEAIEFMCSCHMLKSHALPN